MEAQTQLAKEPSTLAIGLRYGLLTGLVSVLLSFVANTLHQQEHWLVRLLSIGIMVTGIVLAQREFKQRNGGYMGFGQGLGIGMVVALVMGVLGAVFIYLYVTMVAPEMLTQMQDKARADMEARGNLTDADIDRTMAMTSKFMTPPVMAGGAVLITLFMGLVISLVSSAFVKNAKPEFE